MQESSSESEDGDSHGEVGDQDQRVGQEELILPIGGSLAGYSHVKVLQIGFQVEPPFTCSDESYGWHTDMGSVMTSVGPLFLVSIVGGSPEELYHWGTPALKSGHDRLEFPLPSDLEGSWGLSGLVPLFCFA